MTIINRPPAVDALPTRSASAAVGIPQSGLTSDEAGRRLAKFGPNAMPDTALHPLRMAMEKFWALTDAWNSLEAQPWSIMSIGMRDWALGF